MFEKVRKIWMPPTGAYRRRRALEDVRRQIAACGYTLDDLSDSQLEAAITPDSGKLEKTTPLTARRIFWTLRRIAPDAAQLRKRKINRTPRV